MDNAAPDESPEPIAPESARGGTKSALIGILVALIVGALVAVAGSVGGMRWCCLPVFALCALVALGVNWLAFIPASLMRSEAFYDVMGMVSYLSVVAVALFAGSGSPTSVLLAALITLWTLRLGIFLAVRIHAAGTDDRFDRIKNNPLLFLRAWTMQALWVLLTAGAALAAMTSGKDTAIGPLAIVGGVIWLIGFAVEVIADSQKQAFKRDPANKGRFISTGLWAWSRHPNYFGEITLWVGVALIAIPALSGWQFVTLISPVFVALLLMKVSGVPLLEAKGKRRWGSEEDYRLYVKHTPVLFPRPPKR